MRKIHLIEKGDITLHNIIAKNPTDYNVRGKSVINVFRTTDNKECKFIIYLYNYLKDHESLIAGAPDQFRS